MKVLIVLICSYGVVFSFNDTFNNDVNSTTIAPLAADSNATTIASNNHNNGTAQRRLMGNPDEKLMKVLATRRLRFQSETQTRIPLVRHNSRLYHPAYRPNCTNLNCTGRVHIKLDIRFIGNTSEETRKDRSKDRVYKIGGHTNRINNTRNTDGENDIGLFKKTNENNTLDSSNDAEEILELEESIHETRVYNSKSNKYSTQNTNETTSNTNEILNPGLRAKDIASGEDNLDSRLFHTFGQKLQSRTNATKLRSSAWSRRHNNTISRQKAPGGEVLSDSGGVTRSVERYLYRKRVPNRSYSHYSSRQPISTIKRMNSRVSIETTKKPVNSDDVTQISPETIQPTKRPKVYVELVRNNKDTILEATQKPAKLNPSKEFNVFGSPELGHTMNAVKRQFIKNNTNVHSNNVRNFRNRLVANDETISEATDSVQTTEETPSINNDSMTETIPTDTTTEFLIIIPSFKMNDNDEQNGNKLVHNGNSSILEQTTNSNDVTNSNSNEDVTDDVHNFTDDYSAPSQNPTEHASIQTSTDGNHNTADDALITKKESTPSTIESRMILPSTNIPTNNTLKQIEPPITTPTKQESKINNSLMSTHPTTVTSINTPIKIEPRITTPSIVEPTMNIPIKIVQRINTLSTVEPTMNTPIIIIGPRINTQSTVEPTINTPIKIVPRMNTPSTVEPTMNTPIIIIGPRMNTLSTGEPTTNTSPKIAPSVNTPPTIEPTRNTSSPMEPTVNTPSTIENETFTLKIKSVTMNTLSTVNTPSTIEPTMNTPIITLNTPTYPKKIEPPVIIPTLKEPTKNTLSTPEPTMDTPLTLETTMDTPTTTTESSMITPTIKVQKTTELPIKTSTMKIPMMIVTSFASSVNKSTTKAIVLNFPSNVENFTFATDNVLLRNNNEVISEIQRLNMLTYVLAGFGTFPIIIILIYVVKVLYKRDRKIVDDIQNYFKNGKSSSSTKIEILQEEEEDLEYTSEYVFDRNNLRLQSILGEGHFGQVWKAEADDLSGHLGTTRIVAVKAELEISGAGLKAEAAIMRKLETHPNVVTLLGVCMEKAPHFLIMEFAMRGHLLGLLRACRRSSDPPLPPRCTDSSPPSLTTPLSSAAAMTIGSRVPVLSTRHLTGFAHDVARGMEYVASKKIVHRDLAARNILIDHNGVCKISDFGMSIDLDKNEPENLTDVQRRELRQAKWWENRQVRCGGAKQSCEPSKSRPALPVRWMAPESLQYHVYNTQTDVWAFGVLMWEIFTLGCTPYPSIRGRDLVRLVPSGLRLDRPRQTEPQLHDVMKQTWQSDPMCRPSFTDCRHELARILREHANDAEHSDYFDVSGFSGELDSELVYFRGRISEFECDI